MGGGQSPVTGWPAALGHSRPPYVIPAPPWVIPAKVEIQGRRQSGGFPLKTAGMTKRDGGQAGRRWTYRATVGMREEGGSGQPSLVSLPPGVIPAPLGSFPPLLGHSREGGNPWAPTIGWIPAKNCGNDREGRRACRAAVDIPGDSGHDGCGVAVERGEGAGGVIPEFVLTRRRRIWNR